MNRLKIHLFIFIFSYLKFIYKFPPPPAPSVVTQTLSFGFRFMVGKSQSTAACVLGTRQEDSYPEYHLSAGCYNGLIWPLNDPKYPNKIEPLFLQNPSSEKVWLGTILKSSCLPCRSL